MRIALGAMWITLLAAATAGAVEPFDGMLKLKLGDQTIEGSPVAWNSNLVYFLERDGRLREFSPQEATNYRKTSSRFQSYSVSELRAALLRDLAGQLGDNDFEVSGTGHYLVAHRSGQRDKWAERFEDLYRSFVHYFSVRGFQLKQPPCPLIGIVCRDRRDFARYMSRLGTGAPADAIGAYMLDNNRIVLYDMEMPGDDQWQRTASVIIHEATHQTAFNTGIHSRYSPPPLWVVEGLATMFEAPGVYDSRYHTGRGDRINREWLDVFQQQVAGRLRPEMLAGMVASDQAFRRNPAAGYAMAWAMSFYLVETQPRQYVKYLALTAERPPMSRDTPGERTAAFVSVFGDDWTMLQARLLRFLGELE